MLQNYKLIDPILNNLKTCYKLTPTKFNQKELSSDRNKIQKAQTTLVHIKNAKGVLRQSMKLRAEMRSFQMHYVLT